MDNGNGGLYPFEITDVAPDITEELNKYREWPSEYIFIGPNKYFMPKTFKTDAARIYNMGVRASDVWLVGTGRSGTSMMQELIWQLTHDLDYEKSKLTPLTEKFPILEYGDFATPEFIEHLVKQKPEHEAIIRGMRSSVVDRLDVQSSAAPRFIKTHLPLSLLPPGLLDTAKVVYVTRNPLDVSVSSFYLFKLLRHTSYKGDFPSFWKSYVNGYQISLPFFPCVKEAWANKDHPNMLLLFYEEVVKDMPKTIRRVASFFGKEITDVQVSTLAQHLSMENCKKNESMNLGDLKDIGWLASGEEGFIRKGGSGGWRKHFDPDMTRQAEQWIADNLKDTDLRFPDLC